MTNSIVNFPTVQPVADLANALAGSQVNETTAGSTNFLKIDFNTGIWTSGQDSDDVTGQEVIICTPTIRHGWILWSGGRPKKRWAKFTEPLPMRIEPVTSAQGQLDEPSEARGLEAAFTEDGTQVTLDTNSYGGRKAIDTILSMIRVEATNGGQFLYPVVTLSNESYPGKGMRAGKDNFNPVFKFVAWADENGNRKDEIAEVAAPVAKVQKRSRAAS